MSDETVYVRAHRHGGGGIILHTDEDCSRLKNARSTQEYQRDSYPEDTPVCRYCSDSVEASDAGSDGPWQELQEMNAEDIVTDGGLVDGDYGQVDLEAMFR